jgi:hypothetical protein
MYDLAKLLQPRPRNLLISWMMVIFLIVATIFAFFEAQQLGMLIKTEEIAQAKAYTARQRRSARVTQIDPETTRKWQNLRAEIDFPWSEFFDVVEHATNAQVELLEMVPEKQNKAMVLRGEARDGKALLAYLSALDSAPQVREVFLTRRRSVARAELITVEFEIRATLGLNRTGTARR